jgi:ABC-type transport system involved in multi-copper enzyme maturation permease subunit
MITGPIFRVEVVSAARRRRYFVLRVIFAGLLLSILWMTFASSQYAVRAGGGQRLSISELAEIATTFFLAFSWMQLVGMLAVAPAMAVGTIATERERRTIEYLFATDLSNVEIVLGKTVARLLLIGQMVLVSLPILFLFRLLGGIPADLLAASFLIACSTALFITAISVCVSVWSKRSRDATIRVYLVLGALLFVPGILSGFFGLWLQNQPLWVNYVQPALNFLLSLNPLMVLGRAMGNIFAAGAAFDFAPVLRMAAWHAGLSVALVALATLAVRRVHLRESSRGSATKGGGAAALRWRLPRWRPPVSDRPMLWKEAFAATSKTKLGLVGAIANIALTLTILGVIGLSFYYAYTEFFRLGQLSHSPYFEFVPIHTGFVGVGLLLLIAARASSLITIEKERDCWVSLLSTPVTGAQVILGKAIGNLYSFRLGALLLGIAWLLAAFFDIRYLGVVLVLSATFLLCAVFVTLLGLAYSLHSKTSLRSMGLTLLTCIFIGGGYMMCCCPLAIGFGSGNDDIFVLGFAPCIPFLLVAPAAMYASNSTEGVFFVAYCLGVIGYTIACAVMGYLLCEGFDKAAGRTADLPEGRAEPVIVTERGRRV